MVTHGDRVTTHLELTNAAQVVPSERELSPDQIQRSKDPNLSRRLYEEIGLPYGWIDRLPWSDERWAEWTAGLETWVLRIDGEEAGFAELQTGAEGALIAIFGVRPKFRGRGLGGAFLTVVLRRGFELADRVWVETNSADGPHALANYEARGMRVFTR